MKFDFTTMPDRKGKDAIAAEVFPNLTPEQLETFKIKDGFSLIPMWVADMNYATAPSICERMVERIQHPLFGYFMPREEYFDAIIKWHERRNGVEGLTKESIGYENGVLGGVASALQAFTSPGEPVLLHSPTYVGFTGTMNNAGRTIVHSDLVKDENGVWRMDYEDMDRKIKQHNIHCAIFCSPHNPSGRVWEREEVEKAMEVYKNNDCIVISDEIWSDLILPGHKHVPTQSVSEDAKNRTIAIYAPSKTFSLAGLVGSYHIIYNKMLRDRVMNASNTSHYNSMNVLSMYALMGAYEETGEEWLEELLQVLKKNVDYAYDFITENWKGVKLSKPEGTYMLYLDCSEWCKENGKDIGDVIYEGMTYGVIWQDGRPFNRPDSIRMNLAVPYDVMVDAFDRLNTYVFNK
ncbi:MAG: aminotransferase class I/II-fold pyridoxal phosphate-dependent enzyme [Ruminococcus sp.]|nr:aminotransferase class I/II-fold pyridoxal phosphate-dependent enzyme [Ruminococcus sp.]